MNDVRPSPRYADAALAWEYDQRQPAPLTGELEWYLKCIGRVGRPVLELMCGSGRLTIPIAQAGHLIDGVDSSSAMLRRLREKLNRCDPAVRKQTRVFCADVLDFVPERRYSVVLLLYNSLSDMETKEQVAALFSRVRTFLRPQSTFLFDVRRLDAGDPATIARTIDWMDQPVVDGQTGMSVASRLVSSFDRVSRRIANHRTYVIRRGDGSERALDFVTYAPVITTREYLEMLTNAGFAAVALSGYTGLPDDGLSREVCFVAESKE